MNYQFSEETFKTNFKWKSKDEVSSDSIRITHNHDKRFKLFPFTANGKTLIVTDMEDVIGDFIKDAINVNSPDVDFNKLIEKIYDETVVEKDNKKYLASIIHTLFFRDDKFVADNIGLYAYKGKSDVAIEGLARYFNDVFRIDQEDCDLIKNGYLKI